MNQQNIIANQETPIVKNQNMNDCDYLNDMLSTEKHLSDGYSIVCNEASNDTFFKEMLNIMMETKNEARELFNLLFQKGWYRLEKAEEQKVSMKYNEYQQRQNEL